MRGIEVPASLGEKALLSRFNRKAEARSFPSSTDTDHTAWPAVTGRTDVDEDETAIWARLQPVEVWDL